MFNIIFVSTISKIIILMKLLSCANAEHPSLRPRLHVLVLDDGEAPSFYGVKQRMRGNDNVLEMKVPQDVLVSLGALRLQGDV